MTRLKVAELTSGVGALVLGIGLGALTSHWVGSAAGLVTLMGLVTHGVGMWDKHRLESMPDVADRRWTVGLYWACWLLLVAVFVFLVLATLKEAQ
jgi:hypothetical protein